MIVRAVAFLVGLCAFLFFARAICGESTVMGGLLERIAPRWLASARICYVRPEIHLDLRTDPPRYIGTGDAAARAFDGEFWDRGLVRVCGRRWKGGGFWAPTRHGAEVELQFGYEAFVHPDTGEVVFDLDRAETLRRIALDGFRRDNPDHAWLEPQGLDTAPFDERWNFRTAEVRSSRVLWTGYWLNGFTLAAVWLMVWAVWPRRKVRAT